MAYGEVEKLSQEYENLRADVKAGGVFRSHFTMFMGFRILLGSKGPRAMAKGSLESLRKVAGTGKSEASSLLAVANVDPGDNSKDRHALVATLKMLRHLYCVAQKGSQTVWVWSLPNSYRAWPHEELDGKSGANLVDALNDVSERFSKQQRSNLSTAAIEGNRWISLTLIVLGGPKDKRNALVKKWFADENTTDEEIDKYAERLRAGFKKVAAAINSNSLVLTDNPKDRGTSFENSEAYVYTGGENIKVIYVEGAFFQGQNTLTGAKNEARIIVHELTHSEVNTDDYYYSWQGMKPNSTTFPTSKAINNADSWAFFAADCANQLEQGHITTALGSPQP